MNLFFKRILSVFLLGLFVILVLFLFFMLSQYFIYFVITFKTEGTLWDQVLQLKLNNVFENIFISLFVIFTPFFTCLLTINSVGNLLNKNTIPIQAFLWKMFIPVWITLWLTMTLNESGFMIVTSIIAFLVLLSPLIQTVTLETSGEPSSLNSQKRDIKH